MKSLVVGWILTMFLASKVFRQIIRHLRGKRSSVINFIKDSAGNILIDFFTMKGILYRFFES